MRTKTNRSNIDRFTLISKNISNLTISRQHVMCSRQHVMFRSTCCFAPSFYGPCPYSIYISITVGVHTYRACTHKFLRTTSDQLTLPLFAVVLACCFRTPGILCEFSTCPNTLLLDVFGFFYNIFLVTEYSHW